MSKTLESYFSKLDTCIRTKNSKNDGTVKCVEWIALVFSLLFFFFLPKAPPFFGSIFLLYNFFWLFLRLYKQKQELTFAFCPHLVFFKLSIKTYTTNWYWSISHSKESMDFAKIGMAISFGQNKACQHVKLIAMFAAI